MKRIGLILALSLFFVGVSGSAEPSVSSANYREFYDYAIKNIALSMKRAGFIIVQEKFEIRNSSAWNTYLWTLFRVKTYPEALKKYFGEPRFHFFSVELLEDKSNVYLHINGWDKKLEELAILQFYESLYRLRLDSKVFSQWSKIVDSEIFQERFKDNIILGLTGIDCVSRPEIRIRPTGFREKSSAQNSGVQGGYAKKFSPAQDKFFSLLFKELKNSYNLRFTVSPFYPAVELKIFAFPQELENFVSAKLNRVILEAGQANGKEWLTIANRGKTDAETAFFTVELANAPDIAKMVKDTAQNIFNGFYFPNCVNRYGM